MSRLVFAFGDPDAREVGRAGGKAARLAELTRVGIRVPPGFVVGTDAWREFDGDEGREQRVGTVLARISEHSPPTVLDSAARELQHLVVDAAPPDGLADEVEAAYARLSTSLGSADPPGAVRSSATAEDASEGSFAGQYESYLWVRGTEAVLRSIQLCWASYFGAAGLAYGLRRGVSTIGAGMGVVVQAMVRARASGVMFTCDPTSGDPSTICIEGSWGLGSAVVGGEVTPDQFTVAKPTMSIRDRQIRRKEIQHVPIDGGGTRAEAVARAAAEPAWMIRRCSSWRRSVGTSNGSTAARRTSSGASMSRSPSPRTSSSCNLAGNNVERPQARAGARPRGRGPRLDNADAH
jgi:pyruvate, water dikinase